MGQRITPSHDVFNKYSSHVQLECSIFDFYPPSTHNLIDCYVHLTSELGVTIFNSGSINIPILIQSLCPSVVSETACCLGYRLNF